jgi:hypothetical protein
MTSGGISLEAFGAVDESKLVELVRVAETAERYEDMCKFVKKLVEMKSEKVQDLDVEERNLLSVAYKNVVGSKRASWRTLSGGFDDADQSLIDQYKNLVEQELEMICQEVLDLLQNNLLKTVKDKKDETEVFYLKMCGDYYRYLAEFRPDAGYAPKSQEYYSKAMEVAQENLSETHPTRLGLALNFSVCYYEILKEPEKACELAKKSFDAAIEKLDTLNDASYKDSTLIMQLLRDNLTLWTSEQNDDKGDDE